jgi:inosine/xanthosine triphosphate pyrophosphatase family protein
MLTLVTSNPAKYAPFAKLLEQFRVTLEIHKEPLPEVQTLDFTENLSDKAKAAAQIFRRPVLVDDSGIVLEAYQSFPGPLTSTVLRSLGIEGLRRLLSGTSNRARMECHLGCWMDNRLRAWSGAVEGHMDFGRHPANTRMILTDLFIPDEPAEQGALLHRARALEAFQQGAFDLHLDSSSTASVTEPASNNRTMYDCPFCAEFEQDGLSIFARTMAHRLQSRILYQDEDFVVMPPLGQFMEGGLLLLAREHILSLAWLKPAVFDKLERLLSCIRDSLAQRWGVAPLIFEHGPAPEWGKGVCCVDHAHLNIFPAPVRVAPHLETRMSMPISSLCELPRLRQAEFGYLMVQENDGTRRVYDGKDVPTQLVRRIITTQLRFPERWHWRDYLGTDELLATYHALKGQIRL